MIITESRLRKIIRHVLSETERQKRMSLGTYKRDPKAGGFRKPIHQTMGTRDDYFADDGYDSIMGFDEVDEVETDEPTDKKSKKDKDKEKLEATKPPGCS